MATVYTGVAHDDADDDANTLPEYRIKMCVSSKMIEVSPFVADSLRRHGFINDDGQVDLNLFFQRYDS